MVKISKYFLILLLTIFPLKAAFALIWVDALIGGVAGNGDMNEFKDGETVDHQLPTYGYDFTGRVGLDLFRLHFGGVVSRSELNIKGAQVELIPMVGTGEMVESLLDYEASLSRTLVGGHFGISNKKRTLRVYAEFYPLVEGTLTDVTQT